MGGTLDGDGLHWLDRFLALYKAFGVDLPRDSIRDAFDEAERRSTLDDSIASSDFAQMIELHVKWQLAHLGLRDPKLERHLVEGFIEPVREAAAANTLIYSRLSSSAVLNLGWFPTAAATSRSSVSILVTRLTCQSSLIRAGWDFSNRTPRSFIHAAEKLGGDPGSMMMVGDSFDRDVRPAKKAGMKTAWLEGIAARECPDPSLVDLRLRKLADLPAALSAASLALA